jgi:competence protein ComGC
MARRLQFFRPEEAEMIRKSGLFMLIFIASTGIGLVTAGDDPSSQQKQSAAKSGASSMTGCVDQQEGHYVLVDDHELKPVANLEADGFPTEGFAKYMGNKVTVRGTVKSDGSGKSVKVRTIEKVSDTCGTSQGK